MTEKLCGLIYDPIFADHLTGAGHPEQPKRTTHTYEVLLQEGLIERCVQLDANGCDEKHLNLVHHAEYLKIAKRDTQSGKNSLQQVTLRYVKILGMFLYGQPVAWLTL